MSSASINMTIDLAAFRDSLTSAFKMYETTLAAMGKESPKAISNLTAELDKLAEKAAKPVILDANGKPMQAAIETATGEMDKLETKAEQGHSKLGAWMAANRQALSQFSLVYRGVMDVYNDITRVFGAFINEQAAAQQAAARVEAAVRSTGGAAGYSADQLKKMAAEMEALYAVDGDELLSKVTTPLLTFNAISGEMFSQAQVQILNMSRALGMDLQGAAMQVGKALQDPIEGLTALRRSGVSFSDEQQEVIKALYNTGQAAEAQKLILAELSKEFGGQAEAFATTGAGKLEALKVSFDNLKESIGGGLVPVLTAFGAVANPVLGWFGSMNTVMQGTIVLLPLAAAGWYALMTSQIATATTSGTLTAALTAASAAVKSFLTTMGPVGWAIMGVTAVVTGITAAIYAKNRAEEESIRNQKQIIQKKQELIGEQRSEQATVIELAKRYEELAGKTKRSKAESEEMSSIITIMKDKYPGIISSTNDFNGALETMRKVADGAKGKLAELNREAQALAATQAKVAVMESRREALKAKSDVIGFVGDLGAAVRGIFGSAISTVQSQLGALGKAMKDDNAPAVKMWIDVIDKQSGVFTRNENERWQLLKLAANDYLRALQDLADVNAGKMKTSPAASQGAATTTPTGGSETSAYDAELAAYQAMITEMDNLRKSETQRITAEYEKRKALALKYASGDEQKRLLKEIDDWKTAEEKKITDELARIEAEGVAKKKQLDQDKYRSDIEYYSNLQQLGVASYDALKKTMGEYYAWAKENLSKEEQAMILVQLRETNLRWGQVKAKEAEEAYNKEYELASIRDEFRARDLELSGNTYSLQLNEVETYYAARREKLLAAGISEEAIEKQKAKAIMKLQMDSAGQMLGGTGKLLGDLANLQNKESESGFKTWKAMALAQAMVDMPSAAMAAYKSMAGIPIVGPALGIAAAAVAVATGLKNISEINKAKFEKKAEGGLLDGPSHSAGGILIEAEGGEYITKKSRVAALGKGIFDFINNGPVAQVRQLFAGMAVPAIEYSSTLAPAYVYAGGGEVRGEGGFGGLREDIRELKEAILGSKPIFNISVDPLDRNPVRISEIAERGTRIRRGI